MSRGDRSRPERTTAERERDREERERRRARRGTGPQAPLSPSAEVAGEPAPIADTSAAAAPESEPSVLEPQPPAPEPEPWALEQETEPVALPEPEPAEPEPAVPAAVEPPATEAFEILPAEHENEHEPEHRDLDRLAGEDHDDEHHAAPLQDGAGAPSAAGREGALADRRAPTGPPQAMKSAGGRRARPARRPVAGAAGRAGAQRRSPPARVLALLALIAAVVAVTVAILSLSSGSHAKTTALPAVVNVLIPEGENRLQIAEIAKAKGLTGSYRRASEHSPLLDPAKYGAPSPTPDLEGFLFPATYELDKGAPALRLVEDQLAAFTEHFGPPQIAAAKALHVTPYQLLTVASMVEREALVPADRPKIAAVIYNRLAQGIPLGIDATIYYAVELEKNIATYTQELTEAQLHIASPYNTRLHTGLPPTPISNPGAASIAAAAHPAKVSYLYYVAGADGCGEQVFSNSQGQFERDASAYRAAVERNGGHPPTCKKK